MYLGIDVGGTNLAAGLTDGEGQILCKASVPVDRAWTDREIAGALARLCRMTVEKGGVPMEKIQAVGMGVPGQVDDKNGVVVHSPNMNFSDTPLRQLVEQQPGYGQTGGLL